VSEGKRSTHRVKVTEHSSFYYRGKKHLRIKVADPTGSAYVYCFNRNYLADKLRVGLTFYLTGIPTKRRGVTIFSQFDYTVDGEGNELRILPIYSLTAGLSQRKLRNLVAYAMETAGGQIQDDIPQVIRKGYGLGERKDLIKEIHFPSDTDSLRRAKEGLSYEEFFKYQLVVAILKNRKRAVKKARSPFSGILKGKFLKSLTFSLTNAQKRVLEELEKDQNLPAPMNRLVQGDVGSGKTVVALMCALNAIERKGQVVRVRWHLWHRRKCSRSNTSIR
jgi:ATP-dependent DNA helicase RecG